VADNANCCTYAVGIGCPNESEKEAAGKDHMIMLAA
jgi:hypothetical protein